MARVESGCLAVALRSIFVMDLGWLAVVLRSMLVRVELGSAVASIPASLVLEVVSVSIIE